ncbi:hypothetical protein IF650_00945 [Cellulosimicrobium terreum]|nr:hypothetical protein [Cellulosimicrobium terreum]
MNRQLYLAAARRHPAGASHLVGLGLDAMRMSAEPSFMLMDGAPAPYSGEELEAVLALVAELERPLAVAGTEHATRWAGASGTVLADRLVPACRDLLDLADAEPDPAFVDTVRAAFARTVRGYLDSFEARRDGERWAATGWAVRKDLEAYVTGYLRGGGLSAQLLTFATGLSFGDLDDADRWRPTALDEARASGLRWSETLDDHLDEARTSESLVDALDACHEALLIAAVVRDTVAAGTDPGQDPTAHTARVAHEEIRRFAEEVAASSGAGLLEALRDLDRTRSGTGNLVETFCSANLADAVRDASRDRPTERWSDVRLDSHDWPDVARAVDARRDHGFGRGPL